jgi:nucleoside 2-deoxyribosyltransferase
MPFAASFDAVWQSVVQPTVKEIGDDCTRADDASAPGYIIAEMLDAIRSADYLIADLTGRNANVFYELGYAHALGKPVILLTQKVEDVPFDLRHERVIEYDDTVAGAFRLKTSLQRFLPIFAANRGVKP